MCACARCSGSRGAADLGRAPLRRDEVKDERGPPEVACAFSVARPRVVELADATSVDHRDRSLDDAARDVAAPVRAKSPVQVPVHVAPAGPPPGRLRPPARIECALAGGDARDRVRKPELLLVEKMLVHESFRLSRVEILEDEGKEARERESPRGLLGPAREVPEDPRVLVPAFRLEGAASAFRARGELVRIVRRVDRARPELHEASETATDYRIHKALTTHV